MRNAVAALACAFALSTPAAALARDTHAPPAAPAPDQVLAELLDGNRRFAAAKAGAHPLDAKHREELNAGQHPKAVVITCSDSRVPPELVFDQGVGDLFVIRLAGNVAVPSAVGSTEYAVEHLGTRLVVVLGHTHCGAVKATADAKSPAVAGANLGTIVEEIAPAVERAKAAKGADLLATAEHENAKEAARRLTWRSAVLADLVKAGKVKIVSGVYDLQSGRVALDPTPVQDAATTEGPAAAKPAAETATH
jgi:carbonic anhydrase